VSEPAPIPSCSTSRSCSRILTSLLFRHLDHVIVLYGQRVEFHNLRGPALQVLLVLALVPAKPPDGCEHGAKRLLQEKSADRYACPVRRELRYPVNQES
jgi:hypothetical protein